MKKDPVLIYAIYAYILLLVLEGALRKWIFPGLATPLLVVRDPFVLFIYARALMTNRFPMNGFVGASIALALLSFVVSFIVGQDNMVVTIFGIRANFLQIPLVFVIGHSLTKKEVFFLAKAFLIAAIPMTLLISAQFNVGQNHRLNIGVGGEGTAALSGAAGRFRPSGTFSFINGLVDFYSLCVAFLMAIFLDHNKTSKWLLYTAIVTLLIAIPVTISRTLVLSVGITLLFSVYIMLRRNQASTRLFQFISIGFVCLLVASSFSSFTEGVDAFKSRWKQSTSDSGGISESILMRMYYDNLAPLFSLFDHPVLGHGIGVGTNVGARMLTGSQSFILGEGEVLRILGEMGIILGLGFIFLRFVIVAQVGLLAHKLVTKNPVPLLIFSATFLPFMIGQWGQATSLGFAILGMGLCIASMRTPKTIQE